MAFVVVLRPVEEDQYAAATRSRQGRALRFSPDVLRLPLEHDWRGNVRELGNVLEFAVAVCKGQTIVPEDLPGEFDTHPLEAPRPGHRPRRHVDASGLGARSRRTVAPGGRGRLPGPPPAA